MRAENRLHFSSSPLVPKVVISPSGNDEYMPWWGIEREFAYFSAKVEKADYGRQILWRVAMPCGLA
jgi:hypothetical protein